MQICGSLAAMLDDAGYKGGLIEANDGHYW